MKMLAPIEMVAPTIPRTPVIVVITRFSLVMKKAM
jgi:hypothetical protein